jgi:glucose-6-phosphate 1-dehydrogenase
MSVATTTILATYQRLNDLLQELDHTAGTAGNRLFYLAIPPQTFPQVVQGLTNARV